MSKIAIMSDNFKEILKSALDLIQKKEGGMIFIGFEDETDKKRILAKISEEFTNSKCIVHAFNIKEQNRDQTTITCLLKIVDEILHQDNNYNQIKENPKKIINNNGINEIPYHNVKIQWESEEKSDEDSITNELNIINESNRPQPIEMDISNMINTLKEQLGPLISKIPELNEKDIEKNESITNEDIINNGDKIESEKGTKEKDSSSDFNPLSLLEGLFKNLENIKDFSEPIIEDEKLNIDPSVNKNEIIEESRNNISEDLDPEEISILISQIIEELKKIPPSSVLILDEIDCAQETTFNIFNEILMQSKIKIPIIIGTYLIRKNKSPRGISNRYLRMLLTQIKIDKAGKTFLYKKKLETA